MLCKKENYLDVGKRKLVTLYSTAVINNIMNNNLSAVVHARYTIECGLERTAKLRP